MELMLTFNVQKLGSCLEKVSPFLSTGCKLTLKIEIWGDFQVPSPRSSLEKNPFLLSSKGDYTPQNLQIEEISRSLPLGVP